MSYQQGDTSNHHHDYEVTLQDLNDIFTPFTDASQKLKERGGLEALAEALKTDLDNGIPDNEGDEHKSRKDALVYFLLKFTKLTM